MKRRRPTIGQVTWSGSEEFRQISRRATRVWNAKRGEMPRCGATRKRDGERCQQWPMQNGRCYLHGGLTPRGDQWHRPQFSSVPRKLDRKLRDREHQAKKLAVRLALMTADERAAYDAWHTAHRPGPPGPRAAARERKHQAIEARAILAGGPRGAQGAQSASALDKMIAEAQRGLRRLSDSIDAAAGLPSDGVFG
jgi:hypothetical protein